MKFFNKSKRNLALIFMSMLLIAITVCPASATKSDVPTAGAAKQNADKYSYMKIPANYEEIATSGDITMSADLTTGLFSIKNNKNGYVWYSTPTDSDYDSFSKGEVKRKSQSQLIIGYVNSDDELSTARMDYLDSGSAKDVVVSKLDNGISVLYTFEIDLSTNIVDEETATEEGADEETTEEGAEDSSKGGEELIVDDATDEIKIVEASFAVNFVLEDGHFKAIVDTEKTKHTEDIIVVDYNVLPYFGAGSWTDEGYMFVPDGSGAIINFNGATGNGGVYSQMVYGNESSLEQKQLKTSFTETVRMPVFGMVHGNDNGFLAIIDEGAAVASIEASSANANKGHNTIGARFNDKLTSTSVMFAKSSNMQQVFRISKKSDDIKSFSLSYYFLENDNADYVGMANVYRDYLLDNKLLTKKDTTPKLNVDLYGAIDVKANFLGVTYSELESLTTYSQATEIAEYLKEKGINNLDMRYLGWGNRGLTNAKIVDKAKTIGLLGGDKEFNKLVSYAKDNKINLYPENDLISFTDGSNKFAAKSAFGQTFYEYQYLRSVYVFDLNGFQKRLLIPTKINENVDSFVKSYSKLGVEGVSLSTLTNKVYSHLKQKEQIYRSKFPSIATEALKTAVDSKLNVAGESANDYAFKYLSKIYKAPIYSSGYSAFDSEVPFYQIVLHGYIPMTGDTMVQSMDADTTFLKCVESGIELLWMGIYEDSVAVSDTIYDELYGSTYTLWADDAAVRYSKYQPLLEKIHDKEIVNHTEITGQVTSTEYSNGVVVYVNFSDKDYTVNGTKVPARNFAYKEG